MHLSRLTRLRALALCAFLVLGGTATAHAQSLHIPFTDTPPRIEEFVSMQPAPDVTSRMAKVEGFVQREPADGAPPSHPTEVYLSYDREHLYAVFLAFDSEPELVRANMAPRGDVFDDDSVNIMIDTDNDQQRGYVFLSNPLGIQWDGQWTEANEFDSSFEAVWKSEGRLTSQGFVVWMAIPFRSIRFPDTPRQTWRVIFNRQIARLGEESFWPEYTLKIEGRLNQAALLTGIENVSPGRNVQLVPYVFGRNFRVLDPETATFREESFDFDAGLDAKIVIQDSLVLDATVNPDFSQVESDQPQVTVNQRFEVQFSERRPLFLENADFFTTPTELVFTRRIIDPGVGAKLTGKRGRWGIGALLINDEAPGKDSRNAGTVLDGEDALIGIFRLARDVGAQSKLGLLVTDRELADGHNRVGGIDGRIKLHENWIANFQVASSDTRSFDGSTTLDGTSYNVNVNRSGKHVNTHTHFIYTSPGFRTQLGFLGRRQRPDARNFHNRFEYVVRPDRGRLNSVATALFLGQIEDADGLRLEWEVQPSVSFRLRGDTRFEASYKHLKERLRPEDFSSLSTNRDYSQHELELEFSTRQFSNVNFNAEVEYGETINFVPPTGSEPELADSLQGSFGVGWRPLSPLRIDATYLYTKLSDRDSGAEIFTNEIARLRANWQFTREFSLRTIAQFDNTDADPLLTSLSTPRNLNLDLLARYVINPWTSLYVGFNTNESNLRIIDTGSGPEVIPFGDDLAQDGRQLFVKFSYLFQP